MFEIIVNTCFLAIAIMDVVKTFR